MRRYILTILILLALVSLAFAIRDRDPVTPTPEVFPALSVEETVPSTPSPDRPAEIGTLAETRTVPFALSISGKTYNLSVTSGTSLYDAMLKLSQRAEISFNATYYSSIGYFIDEIGGIPNGNGKYWFFYVNGESSTVGVSSYIIQPYDAIEWRFKESY